MESAVTILLAPAFYFEDPKKLVADVTEMARRLGISGPFTVVQRPIKPKAIPHNALVISDLPFRLAQDLPGVLAWLTAAVDRGSAVLIPGTVDLRPENSCLGAQKQILEALAAFPKQMKSVRIREGLQLARARGRTIGRRSLTSEQVEIARQAFAEAGSVRGAERALKAKGYCISRSSIQRIVKQAKDES